MKIEQFAFIVSKIAFDFLLNISINSGSNIFKKGHLPKHVVEMTIVLVFFANYKSLVKTYC